MAEPERAAEPEASGWPVPWQAVPGERGGALAWLEYAAYRAATGGLARLPGGLRRAVVGTLAHVGRRVDRRHASAARDFIRTAFEHTGRPLDDAELTRRVHQAYVHLIECTLTQYRVRHTLRSTPDRAAALRARTELALGEEAHAALERGGCVIVSAHCGDWEMASQLVGAHGFEPLYVISKGPKNRYMARHLQALRESQGVRLLPRRGAMASAKAVLRGDARLAMLLDQRARTNPLVVPFFGRPARCDRSAAVLLKRLGCPVVFLAAYKTGDLHWRLEGQAVLRPEAARGASTDELTARVNAELERLIMTAPEQQFWLHDRYRGAPPAEGGVDSAAAGS